MKKGLKNLAGKLLLSLVLFSMVLGVVLAAETQPPAIKVYLAGDSTVKSYGTYRGEGGWGEFLQYYFMDNVTIINRSEGGRSSRGFINEGRLKNILAVIQPGDYLFIQFGHNDCSTDPKNQFDRYTPIGLPDANGVYPINPGNLVPSPAGGTYTMYAYDSGGTFKWFLKQFVDGAKAKGGIPVLVTPVSRMYYDGAVIRDHHDDNTSHGNAYVTAVKQLAAEEKVLCIDMFGITKAMYERLGSDEAAKMHFVKNDRSIDNTHYNKYGAFYVGGLIAEAIKQANISISPYVQPPSKIITLEDVKL